jgi:quercetin dioxygenase-like cupin family protein
MNNDPVAACHEPFHKIVFENEFARFFSVELPPGATTRLHRHDADYYVVIVAAADIEDTTEGQAPEHVHFNGGEMLSGKRGHVHRVKNLGPAPFRNVGIELK